LLVATQVAPLAERQLPQSDAADAYAFESQNLEVYELAHAPDLPFLAFLQHKAQLIAVLPAHARVLECGAVQAQAMVEKLEAARSKLALHPDEIFFLDSAVLADQLTRDTTVLREHQQAGRVDVEPAGGGKAPEVRAMESG
jgi:hypothetical protein